MENLKDFKFESDDFKLCQDSRVIKDKKLATKPTTFLKDAIKRFRKNKSSVVAAYILGALLLLSFIVPLVSPYEVESTPYQVYLPAKIFNTGFGFMDGTKKYTENVYDYKNESLVGSFNMDAVTDIKLTEIGDNFAYTPTQGAYGGDFVISNTSASGNSSKTWNNTKFTISPSEDLTLSVDFAEIDNVYGELAEYKIQLVHSTGTTVIKDYSNDINDLEINISNQISTTLYDARIEFEIKGSTSSDTYLAFNSFELTSTSTNSEYNLLLEQISMLDANEKLLNTKVGSDFVPGYWASTGTLYVYEADVVYADFTYDAYEAVFGDVSRIITNNEILNYIELGYCTYDFSVGPSSFVKIDDACPINEVTSQTTMTVGSTTLYELTAEVSAYKYYGFDSMPRYIFGTDKEGKDLFTTVFDGLKTSLLLAVVVSSICFAIGIVWGAISGYYGGTIDLVMERIVDIIGGIPSLVVITLVILHLGNNIVTMGIALCITRWIGIASRTRSQFYRFKGREYVLASRTLGAKDSRLIFKHILPNAMGTLVTSTILTIPYVIFAESTIAYLGLGLENSNSLGVILSTNQAELQNLPLLIAVPAVILSLIMISFNLFGNGLRDSFNTSLKGSE